MSSEILFAMSLLAAFQPATVQPQELRNQQDQRTDFGLPEGSVVARARTIDLSRDEVLEIAERYVPTQFSPALDREIISLSGQEVIERLCGSVQDGYLEALARENAGVSITLSEPVGERGLALRWPACLKVQTFGERVRLYQLRHGDSPWSVVNTVVNVTSTNPRELLGQRNSPETLRSFIAGSTIEIPGQALPTILVPRDPRVTSRVSSRVDLAAPSVGGSIILGETGQIASDRQQGQCSGATSGSLDDYPLDRKGILAAYRHSLHQWEALNRHQQDVSVVVVDNGFFAIPCRGPGECPPIRDGNPEFSARFPQYMFDRSRFDSLGVGPRIASNSPINYRNNLIRSDAVSGHGTHVAGLTLGGPQFFDGPYRTILNSGREASWMKLVIVNVAPGQRTFARGVEELIFARLEDVGTPAVVNLSLTIDPGGDAAWIARIKRDFEHYSLRNILFVAAAGNGIQRVDDNGGYPALFGGDKNINLIVVGSIDRDERLSSFSGFSLRHVDIVAPGCGILSWLDAEQDPVGMSGTSQAAPLVSFGASLVRSVWDRPLKKVRARLLYSGTLLADRRARSSTRLGVRLNIEHALLLRDDILVVRGENGNRTYLGSLRTQVQGLSCQSGALSFSDPARLVSFKRADGEAYVFWMDNEEVVSCPVSEPGSTPGTEEEAQRVAFSATHEIIDGSIQAVPRRLDIPVRDIVDLVRRELGPSL